MIKLSYRKRGKSPMTMIFYFFLMISIFLMHQFSSYKVLRASDEHRWLLIASEVLFAVSMLLCIAVSCKDPGYLKSDPNMNFKKLLVSCEPSSLCPVCNTVRTPRSRHCIICNRCIDRYDHHCPWINNCVGRGNFCLFISFVFLQTVFLFMVVVVSILCKSFI